MREVDKFATDDLAQMEAYSKAGYLQDTPVPYADLGEIVLNKFPGREHDQERTITINLGLALADMVTAKLVYDKALELGLGKHLLA
jgi:ornithine cyclodeaminase/alanine dehydrogenase-like protein (mu-crystallin family)